MLGGGRGVARADGKMCAFSILVTKAKRINICVIYMTSVDDGFPLEEPALVRDGIEVSALGVPEGRQASRTRCRVADLVPPPLPQTVLPPELWTGETVADFTRVTAFTSFACSLFFWISRGWKTSFWSARALRISTFDFSIQWTTFSYMLQFHHFPLDDVTSDTSGA